MHQAPFGFVTTFKGGAVIDFHRTRSLMVFGSITAGMRCPTNTTFSQKHGVLIRYKVKDCVNPVMFYIPEDDKSDFTQNVKAFEMALQALTPPRKEAKTLKDLITSEAIDKLLKAKPKKYPHHFCAPDPLSLFISRSQDKS